MLMCDELISAKVCVVICLSRRPYAHKNLKLSIETTVLVLSNEMKIRVSTYFVKLESILIALAHIILLSFFQKRTAVISLSE